MNLELVGTNSKIILIVYATILSITASIKMKVLFDMKNCLWKIR
jgi:hypothetical protein